MHAECQQPIRVPGAFDTHVFLQVNSLSHPHSHSVWLRPAGFSQQSGELRVPVSFLHGSSLGSLGALRPSD